MPEYMCGDGPLAGQVFEWDEWAEAGQTLTFCLVDVGHDGLDVEPEADYRVVAEPSGGEPGRLAFVAGRGAWRSPALAGPVPLG
jgi:hypothetical protein